MLDELHPVGEAEGHGQLHLVLALVRPEDALVLVSSNFSTQTSYENQTKKSITNKFVQDAMTEFLRSRF